jgi:GNAT superfamily N-acetyltransferase
VYLTKSDLTEDNPKLGDGNDAGWLFRTTVVKASSPNILGDYAFPGFQSDTHYVRFQFKEDRLEKGVALDLTQIETPEVNLPEGVEIVTWAERPELDRGMYEVALEAEPDIPGAEDDEVEPFEEWLKHHMQAAGDKPEATFVALAGAEVVGWAKFSLTDAMPTTAHHDLTGVKRSWRGRGVARALKATQIAWAKANGYKDLQTRNDERNAPIRHLNEEFGYRPTVGRIYLQGPPAE